MVEFKYEDAKYIHNKNRDAIKNWLLNPPPKHHEMLLEMAGFEYNPNGLFSFDVSFELVYYNDEEAMWLDCFKDLNIGDEEANIYTFQQLLYALLQWLTPTKRLKEYKVHLKKIELGGDFNA